MPAVSDAAAQPRPCRRGNARASTDALPGPRSASAVTAAISTALYSQPPPVTHGPFGPWTLRIAVVIVLVSSVAATGVSAPSASSVPPAVSAVPARIAWRRGGRMPSLFIMPLVPSRPGPPNQPNSFCVPWPTNSAPIRPRTASAPSLMSFSRGSCSHNMCCREPRGPN